MSAGAPTMPGKPNGNHGVALAGLVGGTSFAVVIAALIGEPKLAVDLAKSLGPAAVIVIAALVFLDRWFSKGMDAFERNAVANETLATAVRQIAERDDRQALLMQREIRYVGTQMDKLMERFDEIQKANERAGGARA
jgi:hypothetical protein